MENNVSAVVLALAERVAAVEANLVAHKSSTETMFLLRASYGIFFMQLGFCLLEAGSVKAKNVKSILLKNVLDTLVAGIVWYLWGAYASNAFAATPPEVPTIGGKPQSADAFAAWAITFTFVSCSATIVSGGAASRMKTVPHMFITFIVSGWVYPVYAYWLWGVDGWLHGLGALDYAGGSSVHMLGGVGALVCSAAVGPRYGRFIRSRGGVVSIRDMKGHDAVAKLTGVLILWYGWLSFNGGSVGYKGNDAYMQGLATTNTIVSGSVGGMVAHLARLTSGETSLAAVGNGILAGLVGITSACGFVPVWAALVIGLLSAVAAEKTAAVLMQYNIDDPVDAFATHFPSAVIGIVSVGFFAEPARTAEYADLPNGFYGLFMGGGWRLLGVQVLTCVVVTAWSLQLAVILFVYKRASPKLPGWAKLRYTKSEEKGGIDSRFHDGYAYPDQIFVPDDGRLATDRLTRIRGEKKAGEKASAGGTNFNDTILEIPPVNLSLGGKFFVRGANSSDVSSIFDVVNAAYGVEKETPGDTDPARVSFKDGAMERFQTHDEVRRLMTGGKAKGFVVLETSEIKVVGVAFVEETKKKSGAFVLGPLATHPGFQGEGVSRKLVGEVEAHCIKNGGKSLEARVVNWRTDLTEFYAKLGFLEASSKVKFHGHTVREGTYMVPFQKSLKDGKVSPRTQSD